MATLPADRTKLVLAQSNQTPGATAGSLVNKNAMTEAYDTVDLMYSTFTTHQNASPLAHPDLSVTTSKLALQAVGTAQLADLNVTQGKIALGAVGVNQLDPALSASTIGLVAHQIANPIDHPNASVTAAKLALNSITAANADASTQQAIQGGILAAYQTGRFF